MNATWKAVWSRREAVDGVPLDLNTLLKLDGFDTGASRVEVGNWRSLASDLGFKLEYVRAQRYTKSVAEREHSCCTA